MYVCLERGNTEETGKYIKSVTYELVQGFTPRIIKVTEPPFLLSRVGWGYFTLDVNIEFHPHLNLKNMMVEHELNFW